MSEPQECWFDHEKLEVYREALAFIAWLSALMDQAPRVGEVKTNWTGHPRRFP